MANRRQFVQSGIALAALASSVLKAFPADAAAQRAAPLRLERFVFDNRFAEAIEVARHAADQGIRLTETSGDLTDLWRNELQPAWRQAPAAFAGITTRHGLFVLATLAADHRMRVVFRGEHGVTRDGCVEHVLCGPAGLVAAATPALGAALWAPLLGRAIARCPHGRTASATLTFSGPARRSAARRDEPLFSWVIAPLSAAAPLT